MPVGTDVRTFTDLSDAVIRFVPIDIDNKQYASVHNDDENFSIDKLGLVVKFTQLFLIFSLSSYSHSCFRFL